MSVGIQVGSLVACIKDDWYPRPSMVPCVAFPVKGCVYTVSEIHESESAFRYDNARFVYLRFSELKNPPVTFERYTGEPMWNIDSFRPVKKTDISVFRSELELV
jgi:hypothetical protein